MTQALDQSRPTRREREKLRHREEILSAAQELFAARGFHAVTMHEIADRAEYAIGTVYGFFKNKEDLYWNLLLDLTQRIHAELFAALDHGSGAEEKIARYIRAKGIIFQDHPSFMRLYFAELMGASYNLGAGLEGELRKLYEPVLERLAGVFSHGIEKGEFKKADPYFLAIAIESAANGSLFIATESPDRHDYGAIAEELARNFFEGVKPAAKPC